MGGKDVIEGWVDTKTGADLTGYSTEAIRWIVRKGRVEARKFGGAWLICKADLLAYKERMDALGPARHDPKRNPDWLENVRAARRRDRKGGEDE